MPQGHEPQSTNQEPAPIIDTDNPFASMMRQAFDGVYVLAIDKLARTLKTRGMHV